MSHFLFASYHEVGNTRSILSCCMLCIDTEPRKYLRWRACRCPISRQENSSTVVSVSASSLMCEYENSRSGCLTWGTIFPLFDRSFLDGMFVPEGTWLAPCLYTMVSGVRKLAKKVRENFLLHLSINCLIAYPYCCTRR